MTLFGIFVHEFTNQMYYPSTINLVCIFDKDISPTYNN